ncbi:pre-mRNA-splicing factor CWC22 homolog [Sitophilus oryzae]|uniref:Pre-mRNA-splicing factor CWC22 homolog n=1 Tax=Sitophilus oryzae TaxID=7048 RepID=A0A6J2X9F6_SITOR|nr:pre-mRNA-splicing factor CWC22 homolog [Sitophilus oryzae]XP_030747878.1 pre-mRNA-splicing factor CWC22 homolog [Sitophilus oryzae]
MTSDSDANLVEERRSVSPKDDVTKERSKKRENRSEKGKKRSSRSRSSSRERRRKDRKRRKADNSDEAVILPRYYGDDRRKENNDRYWTKYPKKDENVVGKRYYDTKSIDEDKVKGKEPQKDAPEDKSIIKPREKKTVDLLTSKTGGAYIPPAKLRMMQAEITDKSSAAFQRIAWEALKKSIHGYINKVNTSNIGIIARELLHENIIRGRGLLCKSIIQAQAASPTFTNVYAALVAVINSKFPNIGELLLKRLVLQFKRGFKQNNKTICISAATFVAHLVNQSVAHEILALEILTLLIETPTDDSVEVAIAFLKECGQKLTEVSSRGINAIFEMLRNILHEGQLEKRIQYMIEVMFQIRKDGFKDHAAVIEELDVVEEDDQFTHLIKLDDVKQADSDEILNVFKFDDDYQLNEGKYKILSKEILQTDSESGSGSEEGGSDDEEDDSDDEEEEGEEAKAKDTIIDNTETNLIVLRRTIYLTIQSSLDFEECAHKLLKMELKPGQEIELCHMFLDCCAEQRTYEKFYGLLAQRFCQINKTYVEPFQQIFKDTYATTHRLDANRLRNVSKFFAHLLFTDAIGWEVLEIMKMNEEDTNSSSRIFIKILFQELAEYMGLGKLNARLKDPTLQGHFAGLFPRDNPKNTRFSINFFTSIGLGGLTDELREHLKNIPKNLPVVTKEESEESSSSSSSSSESSDQDSSSESSSDSEEDRRRRKKKDKKQSNKKESKKSTKNDSKSKDEKRKDNKNRKERNKEESEDSDSNKKHERNARKKDYQWMKSRYEDNISQLKNKRRDFERPRSRDRNRVKVEKERRSRSRERYHRADNNDHRERTKRDRRRS